MKNNDNLDREIIEIIEKSEKNSKISEEKLKELKSKLLEITNYQDELNKINISNISKRVVYTDGNRQLMFDNGEFFEVSATDATQAPIKKTRKEATDMYIEYNINNILNPLIKRKKEFGIPEKYTSIKTKEEKSVNVTRMKLSNKKENIDYER